jgi:hypothetical protein
LDAVVGPQLLSSTGAGEFGNPAEWTPRELRHSFVSLLSDDGMSLEEIADLCGLRPVLLTGAIAMDRIFGRLRGRSAVI